MTLPRIPSPHSEGEGNTFRSEQPDRGFDCSLGERVDELAGLAHSDIDAADDLSLRHASQELA